MSAVGNGGERSAELYRRAVSVIPGGVNSPVRAFRAVGGDPPFLKRGEGALVWDEDGREYIDLVSSWGPLICSSPDGSFSWPSSWSEPAGPL